MHSRRHILMTTALPYANAPLHLGHILEHIQSHIWYGVMTMRGHHCLHVCGSDAHGTAIMLKAREEGLSPEELIDKQFKNHQATLAAFGIHFDCFSTTHAPENQALLYKLYARLDEKKLIHTKTVAQAYDLEEKMFLPDRYVKGECPQCGSPEQYGDSCEHCGATYTPLALKNPRSILSQSQPIEKDSTHHFFDFGQYKEPLQAWLNSAHIQKQVRNKLQEWFEQGLKAWDISRDAPYFGFTIPGHTDRYFYVWMDAPVGYLSAFQKLCHDQPERLEGLFFEDYLDPQRAEKTGTELVHFIGKDIIYFHTLFWPAMLMGAGYRPPSAVFAHGYLSLDHQKMSKSRGIFISPEGFLKHYPADALRYYFAAKLNDSIDDLDFNHADFIARVNADIVGKLVNIASRCAPFIHGHFEGKLSPTLSPADLAIYDSFLAAESIIFDYYESRHTHMAIREIMALADEANKMIDQHKPWQLIKDTDPDRAHESRIRAHQICSLALNLFRVLMSYLSPVLIDTTARAAAFLKTDLHTHNTLSFLPLNALRQPLYDHAILPYQPLFSRLILQESLYMPTLSPADNTAESAPQLPTLSPPLKAEISIDDFSKLDLRIVRIVAAESIPEADKLLKLQVDLGSGIERTIFAGIKSAYQPEQLIGKLTVIVANLAPRKMRFGLSQGMVLAAGPGGHELFILCPEDGATPGMAVK